MQEIWKDIYGYEDLYQVSDKGNVRNKKTGNILKPSNRLYQDVDLSKDGIHRRQAIHRLVALHFIPNPCPKVNNEVNHIDGNKHNNNVDNLEWVSQDGNLEHAKSELGIYPFGKKPKAVEKIDYKTNEVIQIYNSVSEAGASIKPSARISITACCTGKLKSAYGYKWRYAD